MEHLNDGNCTLVCRFCLSQAGVMSSIFNYDNNHNNNNNSLTLSARIMAVARVQVRIFDD